MDITPANLTETEPQTGAEANAGTASIGTGFVQAKGLLTETLAKELWQEAGAELLELAERSSLKSLRRLEQRTTLASTQISRQAQNNGRHSGGRSTWRSLRWHADVRLGAKRLGNAFSRNTVNR